MFQGPRKSGGATIGGVAKIRRNTECTFRNKFINITAENCLTNYQEKFHLKILN